jgi:hypothetical protein
MAKWGIVNGEYVPLAPGQQSEWTGAGTVQGDASGSNTQQLQSGAQGGDGRPPYINPNANGDFTRYLDPGVSPGQFGFSRYDPINDIAYDQNGNPVVDDGSDPALSARLQAMRDATAAKRLEFGSKAGAVRELGNVASQTSNVANTAYGPDLAQRQRFADVRIREAAEAANALGLPVSNAGAINSAMTDQTGAARAISTADAMNAARQNAQLGEYGQDLSSFRTDIDLLRRTAEGKGPSAAQALAQQQLGESVRNMSAVAAGARGGNVSGGIRAATRAGSDMMLRSQQQIAALRAQEQLTGQQQLASAQQGLATAQAQRGQVINAARSNDTNKAIGAAGAFDAVTGRQLGLGEIETARQTARGQQLGQVAGQQNVSTQNAAEIARDEEDARHARARTALDAYQTLTSGGMAPDQAERDRELQRWSVKKGQEITGKDVLGGIFSLGHRSY